MNRYTRTEEKLIMCSGCSEIVSVEREYDGDLCPSCMKTNPYLMQGNSSMTKNKNPVGQIKDYALLFYKIAVTKATEIGPTVSV